MACADEAATVKTLRGLIVAFVVATAAGMAGLGAASWYYGGRDGSG